MPLTKIKLIAGALKTYFNNYPYTRFGNVRECRKIIRRINLYNNIKNSLTISTTSTIIPRVITNILTTSLRITIINVL